jgi:hypothetical protein
VRWDPDEHMTVLQHMKGLADDRITKQLDDVCAAIHEVLMQIGESQITKSDTAEMKLDRGHV